jgi:hypothetical protein
LLVVVIIAILVVLVAITPPPSIALSEPEDLEQAVLAAARGPRARGVPRDAAQPHAAGQRELVAVVFVSGFKGWSGNTSGIKSHTRARLSRAAGRRPHLRKTNIARGLVRRAIFGRRRRRFCCLLLLVARAFSPTRASLQIERESVCVDARAT